MSSPWKCESVLGSEHSEFSWTLYSLVHDDGNGIVQNTLAKDDRVELGVDLGRIEDGEDSHGIRRGQRRSKDETLEERKLESLEAEQGPDVHENAFRQFDRNLGSR